MHAAARRGRNTAFLAAQERQRDNRAVTNWDSLDAATITSVLAKNDFETFVGDVLRYEATVRFDLGADQALDGPNPPDVPDGGADFVFTVPAAPNMSGREFLARYGATPVLPDEVARAYSCKTGKTWRSRALAEAREGRPRVVDVLKSGGSLHVLTNQAGFGSASRAKSNEAYVPQTKEALRRALANAYAAHTGLAEETLSSRIAILDANDLRSYLSGLRPPLRGWAARLGVAANATLMTLAQWESHHYRERLDAPFHPGRRQRDVDAIVSVVQAPPAHPADRCIWIVGAPGVGKTRLVLEALKAAKATDRCGVALDPDTALKAISDGAFKRQPDLVIIADDVPPERIHELEQSSFQMEDPRSLLIMLSPVSPRTETVAARGKLTRIELEPLDRATIEEIMSDRLGGDDAERITRLAALSGGSPLFAILIAREVQAGAPVPLDVRTAAKHVLASQKGVADWPAAYLPRARALYAVMLTADADWGRLAEEPRSELLALCAFERWDDLLTAYRHCVDRGLVRERGPFKYVTPEILEREVLRLLFLSTPPDPARPPRRGHSAERFYARVDQLLDSNDKGRLAADVVVDLEDGAAQGIVGLTSWSLAAMMLAARYSAAPTGRVLRGLVDRATLDDLRRAHAQRRSLVWTLYAVARRDGGFHDGEAGLFRLALAENESWSNNATGMWAQLFVCALNVTREPWPVRGRRLAERFRDTDRKARLIAVSAAPKLLSSFGATVDHDEDAPTRVEENFRTALLDTWQLLIERAARDDDGEIRNAAQQSIGSELRGAFHQGIAHELAGPLCNALASFADAARRGVRESLGAIRAYDAEQIASDPQLAEALLRLEEATAPQTYRERLRLRIGTWGVAAEREDDDRRDEELAREGLANDGQPLLDELDWLLGPEAKRSAAFALALGRVDRGRVLLGDVIDRARSPGDNAAIDFVALYMRGQVDGGLDADPILREWRDEPALLPLLAVTLGRLPGADARASLLTAMIRDGSIPDDRALHWLAIGRWAANVGSEYVLDLIDALLAHHSPHAWSSALDLSLDRAKDCADDARIVDAIVRSMERLAVVELHGMTAYAWELAGQALLRAGRVDDACRLAVAGVVRSSTEHADEHQWRLLANCISTAPQLTWGFVREVLDGDADSAVRLASDLRWHRLGNFPVADVVAWIADDPKRAALVSLFAPIHADELPPVARALITRFGAESTPAKELAAAFGSTIRTVPSLAEFHTKQAARARAWVKDSHPEVRRWASRLAESLSSEAEYYSAAEEFERRRYGS